MQTQTLEPRPADDARAPGRSIPLAGGRSLYMVEAGSGPPVVLLHGALATSHDMLVDPFDRLTPAYRTIAVDRPGHGVSVRDRFESSPRRQAELIREGLRAIGVERPVIVGHSMGGYVALAYAESWPQEVAGLVLLSPMVRPEVRWVEHTLFAPRSTPVAGPALSLAANVTVDPALLTGIGKLMFSPQPIPERWLAEFPQELVNRPDKMLVNGEDAAAMHPASPLGWLNYARIRCPVRILAGAADKVVDPLQHAAPLTMLVPQARLKLLPGLGHMLHHFAQDEVVAAVEEVLGG